MSHFPLLGGCCARTFLARTSALSRYGWKCRRPLVYEVCSRSYTLRFSTTSTSSESNERVESNVERSVDGTTKTTNTPTKRQIQVKQQRRRGETTTWTHFSIKPDGFRVLSGESTPSSETAVEPAKPTTVISQIRDILTQTFLPRGFPHTVQPTYFKYTSFTFLNAISGTLTSILSTQALLQALNFSTASAAGLAATANWIIKDGFGLLGGVIYAALVNNKFDSQPKRYRFIANVCLQGAVFLELLTPILTPIYSSAFLILASLSNIGKNISWLAVGATRASMHKSFLRADNMGDVTAKSGAQTTAAGLIGTGVGVGLTFLVGNAPSTLIITCLPLMAINLWSLSKANNCVVTRTIDIERGERIVASWIRDRKVASPEEIATVETFILPYKSVFKVPLVIEGGLTSLEPKLSRKGRKYQESFINTFSQTNLTTAENYYLFVYDHGSRSHSSTVSLWFAPDASPKDMMRGLLHACLVREQLQTHQKPSLDTSTSNDLKPISRDSLIQSTHATLNGQFDTFYQEMNTLGWSLDTVHIGDCDARVAVVNSKEET